MNYLLDTNIIIIYSALGVPLVTTDKDFNHLKDVFIDLIYIDISKYKK
jgi:predicted nucleic acid-binding protein